MGEFSLPTTADYALSSAEKAQQENRGLRQRVTALESQLAKLTELLVIRGKITINDARGTMGLPGWSLAEPGRQPAGGKPSEGT